ncbi:MAG: F0F1 ATP synthase subunit A [Bacteroidaceae bacterium]|nr:F0F1 ATP synthase subunit A [Bacteroidaceae bacterium]
MKRLLYILSLLFLWVIPVSAQENAEPENEVDVKGIIFGHLKDSYHWHIITIGEKEVSLQLPVMLYSKVSGWHFFMSDKLEETESYDGFRIAQDGAYAGKLVEVMPDGSELKPLDLSLTKVALGVIINSLLLCVIVMCTARWYRRHSETDMAPGGFVGLMEFVVSMVVDDIIKPSVGKEYKKYAPLLLSLFFFIFFSNIMGLIPIFPAGANVTGNIAVTLFLALITFFTVNIFGNREYWKEILWPDVPLGLKFPVPLLPIIELVGIFTKPFALTVRLFANITSGHAIILALTCVIFITANMGPIIGVPMTGISLLFMVFMNLLELLVAYIQAYVFTMLSSLFIGMSRPEHQHKEIKQEITNN